MNTDFHKLSAAPMLKWTNRHFRFFLRQMSKNILLYTEMVGARAIISSPERYLGFNKGENPLALQIGTGIEKDLKKAVEISNDYDFYEINLNLGCPSNKVQNGGFGAVLMKDVPLVANLVGVMKQHTNKKISVKIRIGVDDQDSYEYLHSMISTLHKHGCNKFIIHARKALLNGISPKENRTIPPLRYDVVHRIKQDFHNLEIVINGGIKTYEEVDEQLKLTDGVMIGREFGNNPYLLAELDCKIYGSEQISRKNILLSFLEYSHKINKSNISNNYNVWLHTHRLFAHQKNSSLFRKIITDHSNNLDTLEKTLKLHEFI